MWYAWLEAQRNLMQTIGEWTTHGQCGSASPERNGSRVAVAGWNWLYRLVQPLPEPPPFGISTIQIAGEEVPVVEQVIDSTPFCILRKFTRVPADAQPAMEPDESSPPEIFLCAPLAGHHAVMLRETVETLLQDGNVYITDWANARDVPLYRASLIQIVAPHRSMPGHSDSTATFSPSSAFCAPPTARACMS
jgi:poly(3-hydroxybutyrate) depolymerase